MATNAKRQTVAPGADCLLPPRRRKAARTSASAGVEVRASGAERFEANLFDLSEHGCSLKTGDRPMRLGQILTVRIRERETITGIVRWTRNGRTGVEFFRPLGAGLADRFK